LNYASSKAPVVSNGAFQQQLSDGAPTDSMEATPADPFRDDPMQLNSPDRASPMQGPTLELNEEPLPMPAVEATDLPISLAPGKAAPAYVPAMPGAAANLSAASSEIMQPHSITPWAKTLYKPVDTVAGGINDGAGAVLTSHQEIPMTPLATPNGQGNSAVKPPVPAFITR
jgi:hypothetical protein